MVMLAVMLVKTLSESEKPHGMKLFNFSKEKRLGARQRNISGVLTEVSNVAPCWSSS